MRPSPRPRKRIGSWNSPAVLLLHQRKLTKATKDKKHTMAKTAHKAIAVIGIDIGKYSFHGADHDKRGTFAAAVVVA